MYQLFRQRAMHWQVATVLVEFLLLLGCVFAAVMLRFDGNLDPQPGFRDALLWRAVVVSAVLTLSMGALGLYQAYLRDGWMRNLSRQGVAFALGGVALMVVFYASPSAYLGRGLLAIAMGLGFVVVAVWRALFLRLVDASVFKRRVLLLGVGERAAEVYEATCRNPNHCSFRVVGCVALGERTAAIPASWWLQLDRPLGEWAERIGVDEIVVGREDDACIAELASELIDSRRRGIEVSDLLTFFEREAGKIKTDLANPSSLMLSGGFNASHVRRALTRAFDLVVASLMLLLAAPLMLATALAIRLESGRGAPVLYRQERVGENGEPFLMVKFRSMRTDAERDGVARWASKDDARVTRVGRYIRKARLDELPQLWNVLRGDMSVVGPRPERPQFVDDFSARIRCYALRHCVKPGLTGWAQLRYPYGSSLEDAEEKLKFDLFYVKNRNLGFDIAIMIQTVEVVLFGRGAR